MSRHCGRLARHARNDSDNLTVRKRIQLASDDVPDGRCFSSDMTKVYSVSDSGVLVLPVSTLDSLPQLAALQEDVTFQSDVCTRSVISQSIDVVDLAGRGNIDFTLSLPSGTSESGFSRDRDYARQDHISVDQQSSQGNAGTPRSP